MAITSFPFGTLSDGTPVTAYRLENAVGASVTALDYGATLQSLFIPASSPVAPSHGGEMIDVLLGYDNVAEYETLGGHLGGTLGRVGNRIGGASFSLNGVTYELVKNSGENHIHGGIKGFDHRMWERVPADDKLIFTRVSPDGEEGYPGTLKVTVTFTLNDNNELRLIYDADADQDTIVNLTNHSYFNLNGGGSALEHELQIFSERITESDAHGLPTGKIMEVAGTPFDFRTPKLIGQDIGADHIQLKNGNGYDHNYIIAAKRAAVLYSDKTGLEMTVTTDLPGMQFYTANGLGERDGKYGKLHPREGVCFETQLFPNAMRCYGFPSPILRAGQHLHTETAYSFRIR